MDSSPLFKLDFLYTFIQRFIHNIMLSRFHYCQAVRRKCLKTTKLFFRKLNNLGGDYIYKMFQALPLLPQDKIDEGFAYIKSQVRCKNLRKLLYPVFKYFDCWWMRSVCVRIIKYSKLFRIYLNKNIIQNIIFSI